MQHQTEASWARTMCSSIAIIARSDRDTAKEKRKPPGHSLNFDMFPSIIEQAADDGQSRDKTPIFSNTDQNYQNTKEQALIALLLDTFFANKDPKWQIVDQEMFEKDRDLISKRVTEDALNRNSQYSDFLESSICAVGSVLLGDSKVFASSIGEQFANKAVSQLEFELTSPTKATLKGLLLLNRYMACTSRTSVGDSFREMVMSFMADLGPDLETKSSLLNCIIDSEVVETPVSGYCTLSQICLPMAPSKDWQSSESFETEKVPIGRREQEETVVVSWEETYAQLQGMLGGDPFAGLGAADISGGTELYWSFWRT